MNSAEELAEWESWVRENMTPTDLIGYHSRLRGDHGWCFGCLELWRRHVRSPCPHRLAAERELARQKSDRATAQLRRLHHG
ncbi:hypothetical protein R8Z50_31150 [Longispora sp. K20-0274]|uniref:hypothetical protein n=1 Tax=Longispora sp. K20-0274 TaxID=3088255 RepID=UPI003999A985